jgi:hypothetical protein
VIDVIVKAHSFAENLRVGSEFPSPEAIADHDLKVVAGSGIIRIEGAAQLRAYTEDREVIRHDLLEAETQGLCTAAKVHVCAVGGYLGLQPGRRNSGQSEPQMHISKEGDPYLRTLLVQGAQHILGPFGVDCDLRRWGLKLAERGGRNGKKRAIVATARKLAVLLHHLWVSGEVYKPLHNSEHPAMMAAA